MIERDRSQARPYRSHKLNVIVFTTDHMFVSHVRGFVVLLVVQRDMFIYIIVVIVISILKREGRAKT